MKPKMGALTVVSLVCAIALVWDDTSKTASKIILGGEWFTTTTAGESGGYLMKDFKDKVIKPILKLANYTHNHTL